MGRQKQLRYLAETSISRVSEVEDDYPHNHPVRKNFHSIKAFIYMYTQNPEINLFVPVLLHLVMLMEKFLYGIGATIRQSLSGKLMMIV